MQRHEYYLEAVVRPSHRFRWTDRTIEKQSVGYIECSTRIPRTIPNAHFRNGLLSLSPAGLDVHRTFVFGGDFDDATSVSFIMLKEDEWVIPEAIFP